MSTVAGAILLTAMQAAAMAAPMTAMPGMHHAAASCPATPAPPPAELAGWSRMVPVAAGAGGTATVLSPGQAVRAALSPTARITYKLPPERPAGATGNGGLFAFAVPSAGRYRVALGSAAWIDVVRDATPIVSVSHAHGPDCSGIRKMVDFDLTPGRYMLQITGSEDASLPLMVVRLP